MTQKSLFLKHPDIKKIRRYESGSDIRFTIPTMLGYEKLVGWARNGKFIWICKGFSA